nr:reverse transcriptase domain-containing protein [Tanacetum cinerariifolium]
GPVFILEFFPCFVGGGFVVKVVGLEGGFTGDWLWNELPPEVVLSIVCIVSPCEVFWLESVPKEANIRNAKGRKTITFDQRIKAKPWKRPGKDSKKGGNLRESQIAGNINGEEDGTEGPMIIEAEMGGHYLHRMYVDGGTLNVRLDELHGGKITLALQQDYRKAREPGVPQPVINQVTEEKIQVEIHPEYPEQTIAISSTLTGEERKELYGLLRRHLDAFAWKPTDMTGVPRHVAEHRLNVREGCLPVRQKKRGQAPERNKAIGEEVKKLVEAGIMKEVHYHSWLSNPVMVKKHDGSWIMEGTFLRYKVDADGLRVCPDKVEAVLNLPSPKCLKDVQKLNGKLASLYRFMSKSAEKYLSFFKTLKKCAKKSDFQRIAEAEMAFKGIKQLIVALPMLTAPTEKEELIMYLAAAKEAISAVLMTERNGKQVPIYFVSRALQGPEINYTPMEKLILALVSASKWLKRYFQAHTIVVITDQPMKQLLSNSEVTGRLLKWRFELGEHDIQYRPRTLVKGQILKDFIVERPKDDTPDTSMEDREELPDPWLLFTNGSSFIDGDCANSNFNHGSTIYKNFMLHVPPENNEFEGEIIPCSDFRLGIS